MKSSNNLNHMLQNIKNKTYLIKILTSKKQVNTLPERNNYQLPSSVCEMLVSMPTSYNTQSHIGF